MASAICAKVGCNLPVFVEPRTKIAHQYCGRTHAQEVLGGNNIQNPHGICHRCNFKGCQKSVAFDNSTGRVHDFCCKDHADRAIASGEWVKPQRYNPITSGKKGVAPPCRFPNCQLPVFTDPSTGRTMDYCGRSHSVEHRLMQARVSHSSSFAAPSSPAAAAAAAAATTAATAKTGKVGFTGFAMAVPMPATAAGPSKVPTAQESTDERKPAAVTLPKCAICLAMNASIIIIPCGHVCLCKEDAMKLRRNEQLLNCPICRRNVTGTNEVFLNH